MSETSQPETPTQTTTGERRRPGRADVSPALIPLLRTGEHPPTLHQTIDFDEPDQVAGARGVFFGVAIAIPLWVSIALVGRWLLT